MRRLAFILVLAAILFGVMAVAAPAGGAVWHFEGYHQPGDVAESVEAVTWQNDSILGTPEDGPYLIYLAPADVAIEAWPGIPAEGLLVGIVEVYLGSYVGGDGESYGPNHAVARFEIPDVPPGEYQIFHCNDPCTTTLGDIVGGWGLSIGGGGDGRPADEIAAEVRERIPSAPLVSPAEGLSNESSPAVNVDHGATSPPEPDGLDTIWRFIVAVIGALLVARTVRLGIGRG